MRKGSCDIKAGSVKEVSHRKEDCRKHGLRLKTSDILSCGNVFRCRDHVLCIFSIPKLSTETIEKCLENCQPLLWLLKSGTFVIQVFWHHWLSRHLWVFSTSEKLSHHLCLRSFSPHKSVPAVFWSTVFYPTVKNRCVSSSHTVIPSEHGRCCEAHVLLEYK